MKSRDKASLNPSSAVEEAAVQLDHAIRAKKCHACGCFHDTLHAIETGLPRIARSPQLCRALLTARAALTERRYDCLGCEPCFPAAAMDALSALVDRVDGWPPLPGDYTVLRDRAPVAICTLTSQALAEAIARKRPDSLAIVGTLRTENLGIERLITNVVANPNLRFLILCGSDSRGAVGHLPGQSLLALVHEGIDARGRIRGAQGKRPFLKNIAREVVEHFRATVEVIDLVGQSDLSRILGHAEACAKRNPGPARPLVVRSRARPVQGYIPERTTPDPAGYFVIYLDRLRRRIVLEHFNNGGVLDCVFEGLSASELYLPAIERGFVSRLDHAAYLGRELAKAELALQTGSEYVQDAAPEQPKEGTASGCGCGSDPARACPHPPPSGT